MAFIVKALRFPGHGLHGTGYIYSDIQLGATVHGDGRSRVGKRNIQS
jgi:hypothetical protein